MNPREAGAYLELGKSCRNQGRWAEAEAALKRALELDPENGWAHLELGTLCLDRDRLSDAAAELEKAIAIDRSNSGAYGQLGRIYHRQGRWPEAEASLRKALELDPRDGGARIELGSLCQDQDRLPEAAAEFERAIATDGNNGWVHGQLGSVYRRQARWAEAEASLRKALELEPQNGSVHIELGAFFLDQTRFSDAILEFEEAIVLDGDNGWAHCQLGRAYRWQGRLPEAETALRQALAFDPRSAGARIELGGLYEDQKRFPEAAAELERAVAIDPGNGRAHCQLGRIWHRQGRWPDAEAALNKALELVPDDACARIELGALYQDQGRLSEAEAALVAALAINPKSTFARAELMDCMERERAMGRLAARASSGAGAADSMREQVFCLLPWTHLQIRTDGRFCPCCDWDGPPLGNIRASSIDELWNSPNMKSLRLDMMCGRPRVGCWKCYEKERSGFLSLRQKSNIELGRHGGRERLTAPDGTLPRLPVLLLEIRFSNVCNLRCRICDASQSSAWAPDAQALGLPVEGGPILKAYDDWDALWRQLQPLMEDGLEEILFLGGEPLVMEEHYRILDFLIARGRTDVRLTYYTNFSALRFQGRDVIGLWSRFRDVRVYASLDGSGRRGEYLRKGLRWAAVVANREEMLRRCPDVAFSISATISIFNALHLPDFHREWVEKGYIDRNAFALNMLVSPPMYRIQVLPEVLKACALESYRRHQESFLDADGPTARDFAAVTHSLLAQDRSDLLPGFVAMTRRLDRLRGEDCREVFPELAALFDEA